MSECGFMTLLDTCPSTLTAQILFQILDKWRRVAYDRLRLGLVILLMGYLLCKKVVLTLRRSLSLCLARSRSSVCAHHLYMQIFLSGPHNNNLHCNHHLFCPPNIYLFRDTSKCWQNIINESIFNWKIYWSIQSNDWC